MKNRQVYILSPNYFIICTLFILYFYIIYLILILYSTYNIKIFSTNYFGLVYRTWTLFVDCTKKYTEHCFEESKRKVFTKAVETSIELVNQMCTSPQYQAGH